MMLLVFPGRNKPQILLNGSIVSIQEEQLSSALLSSSLLSLYLCVSLSLCLSSLTV